tara:strand:+ start:607 stop:1209 length:603 start_codon:yes stop_codon:yes gene_type:complete
MKRYRHYIKNFPDYLRSILPKKVELSSVDIWIQDETRVGQQGSLTRIWAPKGTRPRKVKQQQFISTYIYGSACAATGESFGLVLPYTNTDVMRLYLSNFSAQIRPQRHVALLMDNAGWHTAKDLDIPDNITLIPLPPYSPELNPMEQVWEWIKLNHLSNSYYKNYDDIVEKSSFAWNEFANNPELVTSICSREWIKHPNL